MKRVEQGFLWSFFGADPATSAEDDSFLLLRARRRSCIHALCTQTNFLHIDLIHTCAFYSRGTGLSVLRSRPFEARQVNCRLARRAC